MGIIKKQTTKFTKGRDNYRPEIIVIHLADATAKSILSTFQNEEKSAHYVICRNREIWQFVDENDTAWANGIKFNPTAKMILERPDINPNKYSISIENEGQTDISNFQYEDNARLVSDIASRWLIPLDRKHIIGHYEIRKDKACPRPISVDKILELAQKFFNEPEEKVEVLKKQVSILEELVALWRKLKLLLNK